MIRWCSYCQQFIGESFPYDQLVITHGICQSCQTQKKFDDREAISWGKAINDFYTQLQEEIKSGQFSAASILFDQGLKIGLRPLDLLIGIIQPILYDVGRKWKLNQLSVLDEHRFSELTQELISVINTRFPELKNFSNSKTPKIILTNAPNNIHTFAVQIIELVFSFQKIHSLKILPSLDNRELIKKIKKHRPMLLLISVSDLSQLEDIILLPLEIKKEKLKTKIYVGGFPFKNKNNLPVADGLNFSNDIQNILDEIS